ncbi:MAG: hypothetical protein H0T15_04530 [Thermoleophilaceae bacterium]|nr:hypothetical protein [Thermoleophilaceae bacterium]
MDPIALKNRLVMATALWKESTDEPLPKLPPGDPAEQIQELELRLVRVMIAEATPESAKRIAERTWDLVHDRPETDPVKQAVVKAHEELAELGRPKGEALEQ